MLKDKKITIIGRELYENKLGETSYRDAPIPGGSNIWAYYKHTSAKEQNLLHTSEILAEVVFFINWRDDIKTYMKIEYRGKKYEITRIDDYEGYKNDLKIYAKLERS